jgi:cytoskeletal protein CcmA (bactofilin family)
MIHKNNAKNNILIDEGSEITGNILCSSDICILGNVNGNIKTSGNIKVGETGIIIGNIYSDTLLLYGTVEGNIRTNKSLIYYPTGKLNRSAYTPVIKKIGNFNITGNIVIMDEGVNMDDKCGGSTESETSEVNGITEDDKTGGTENADSSEDKYVIYSFEK